MAQTNQFTEKLHLGDPGCVNCLERMNPKAKQDPVLKFPMDLNKLEIMGHQIWSKEELTHPFAMDSWSKVVWW